MIAFVGSVFSPYYAWARRGGALADPARFCAMNVALYGPGGRWAMTERGAATRTATTLAIGRSSLSWDGAALALRLDERCAPIPRRVRGTVRLHPGAVYGRRFTLDAAGLHRWQPIAPGARVEVALDRPNLAWSGPAYFDTNDGDGPLEEAFKSWEWSRASTPAGAAVLYEAQRRDGTSQCLALRFDGAGAVNPFEPPALVGLPATRLWRIPRSTRAEGGAAVVKTLEDTPFYARSVLRTRLGGEAVTAVHESLSLDRFRRAWVQAMLPFRVPRAMGG